jgi:hypothetical protein
MIDAIGTVVGNPSIAMKQALAKIDLEVARGKGEAQKEVAKEKTKGQIALEGVKQVGRIATEKEKQKTAGIKAAGKQTATKKDESITLENLKGTSVKLNPNEAKKLDKDRETIGRRVAKEIDPDFDPGKKSYADMFTPQEMFTINQVKKNKKFQSKLKKAKEAIRAGTAKRDDMLKKLASKLPQSYAEFLLRDVDEPVKDKPKKKGILSIFD